MRYLYRWFYINLEDCIMKNLKYVFVPLCLILWGLSLFGGSITVVTPNGGEKIFQDTSVEIKWKAQDVDGNMVILLYKKGIKHSIIAQNVPNNGRFTWRVSAKFPEGKDYRIRIRSMENLGINDFSDRNFSILKK